MTDLSNHEPPHSPSFMGFPFLAPPPTQRRRSGREPRRRAWLVALRCRLRRNSIDRELAAGADPDSTECRHLRASQLTAESNREALAAAYERYVAAATSFPPLDVLPVNWRGVLTERRRLDRLAQRLREDPDVRPQGVARARLLLADDHSAMHGKDDDSSLMDEVRSTLALL